METTEAVYLTLLMSNKNNTDSTAMQLDINKSCNSVIDDLSSWNLYINSIVLTSSELPYRNFKNDISWDMNNFQLNKTNLSISLYDNAGYNFNLTGNTNLLMTGIDPNPLNANQYKGVAVFLQFVSENSPLPNPSNTGSGPNTSNYDRTYFNLHSIQQFLDFVNTALTTGLSKHQYLSNSTLYYYYNPQTALFNLVMDDTFKTSSVDLYSNAFLSHFLDGFRWSFQADTHITTEIPYRGMSYKLVKNNVSNNKSNNLWTYQAEYATINNISDILSLVITCDGSLACVRPQVFSNVNDNTSSTLQTKTILKSLDFVFDSTGATINNSIIQFENVVMDKPINILSRTDFTSVLLHFDLLNTQGEMIPLRLNSQGMASLKICLKKLKK